MPTPDDLAACERLQSLFDAPGPFAPNVFVDWENLSVECVKDMARLADAYPALVARVSALEAELKAQHVAHLDAVRIVAAELAERTAERDAAQEMAQHVRASHAHLMRGIKAALGLKNWPEFGNSAPGTPVMFVDGVIGLVRDLAADLAALKEAARPFADWVRALDKGGCPDAPPLMVCFDRLIVKSQASVGDLRTLARLTGATNG